MTEQELFIDPLICGAHGVCAQAAPSFVRLDEDGEPHVVGPRFDHAPPEVVRAIDSCPTGAPRLVVVV